MISSSRTALIVSTILTTDKSYIVESTKPQVLIRYILDFFANLNILSGTQFFFISNNYIKSGFIFKYMSLKCRVTIRNMLKFHGDCILDFILSMKESYDIYLFSYFSPIDIKLVYV